MAARSGAKLVDVGESLVERLVKSKWRKATIAHRLIAVQLHLIRFLDGTCADVIHVQRSPRSQLALHAEAPLQEIRRLQRAAGKGVHVHSQGADGRTGMDSCTGQASRLKDSLKSSVGCDSRIDRADIHTSVVGRTGSNADATHLSVDAAYEYRRIGSIGRAQVGNLRWDNVVEDASTGV